MKLAIAVLAAALLAGCDSVEYSQDMHERAVVQEVIYSPGSHGSGTGVGMSMSGNMVVTSTSVSLPKKYAVVFECVHGKFIVEGTDEKHRELWARLKAGQQVDVTYREVYRLKDGARQLIDYKFLAAK